jgi:NitT/TauT family transport system ATP-binding protein
MTPPRGPVGQGRDELAEASEGGAGDRKVHGGLTLRDIAVSFAQPGHGSLQALDGLDLTVEAGQIVSLIGPNGSGKSTLLRVIDGLLPPDRGEVLLDGRPIDSPDPGIGLVFQEPRLLPWRTTARNITYPLELADRPAAERQARLEQLIQAVGLEGAADLVPSQLSGGMRQRAALARALALQPDVLLLDEPFSALDELTRERFNMELLQLWGRTRTTIVVVTHSIQEAIFLGDRVVVLSERPGRVVADLPVGLPRPRSLDQLDETIVTSTARQIRAHLAGAAA